MFNGNLSTEKRESDVNALAAVKSPPRKVNIPKETTVTTTGALFSMKLLNCNSRHLMRIEAINKNFCTSIEKENVGGNDSNTLMMQKNDFM